MNEPTLYIGLAARLSGTTTKAIRHYETIGLLPPASRQGKYRVYTQDSIEILRFIKCAQHLGFKLKELQDILQEYNGKAFPWSIALAALRDKKNNLLVEIERLQDLYRKLDSFEEELQTAKTACSLET